MSEAIGIKETKEMIAGAMRLGGLLYSKFADGVQLTDFADLVAKIEGDTELKQALMDAYNGADKIPAEVAGINMAEGIELGVCILSEGSKLVASLKA